MRISRHMVLSVLTAGLLGLLVMQSAPAGKGNGKGGGNGDGGTTELPPVRYRIKFPSLPADSTGGVWINDMNNWGQVVGWYSTDAGQRAFLYDPTVDADRAIDLNSLVTAGLPDGWRLRSGVAINDWMVVVGTLEQTGSSPVQVRPFALDLLADNPVVDLLPDVGVDFSYGRQINENGDILGGYQTSTGDWEGWAYNPGLYGDPLDRSPRDGSPIDMSAEIPDPLLLSGRADEFVLNNPSGGAPAQVAGVDAEGVPFRYTLGDSAPERFPELNVRWPWLGGLNDSGTFAGLLSVPREKNRKGYSAPFRFNATLDELPSLSQQPQAINASGDLLFYNVIYRDDWAEYGYVSLFDLGVGSDADLALWNHRDAVIDAFDMNDRAGVSDSGQIVGRLGGVFSNNILFVLTPEPASAP